VVPPQGVQQGNSVRLGQKGVKHLDSLEQIPAEFQAPSPFGGSATRILRQGPAEQNRLSAREKKAETSGPDVEDELPPTAREREVFELGSRGR
jgi:hypothetical protein